MALPTTTNLLLDPTGAPIPQLWDPILGNWYAFSTVSRFKIGNAVGNASGYHFGVNAMSGAGWFKGAAGTYKGSVPVWIMVFNTTSGPGAIVPEYVTPVPQAISGQGDMPWFISPGAPSYMSAGIWIAISTTGGLFTSTTSTDFSGTVEYYAVGT